MTGTTRTSENSPLRYGAYRSIWIATFGSNTGILIQSVGASWLMVAAAASSEMIALVQTAASLPLVVLSPLAGAVADNRDRRLVMIAAQTLIVATSCLLSVVGWLGLATPSLVLACTFLIGCGLALHGPAWMASVGDIVPRSAIPEAVALNALGSNMARSIGPAIGGLLVATINAAAAFAANAVTAIGLVTVLVRWRPQFPERSLPPERLSEAMAAGVRYVSMSPQLRAVLGRTAYFALAGSTVQALLPLVARDMFRGDAGTYGILFATFGVGAFLGAFFNRRLRLVLSPERLVRATTVASALASAVVAFSRELWLTGPALALAGAAWVIGFATFNVRVQVSSPRWVVARTLSLYQMSVYVGVALGSWLSGLAADHFGTEATLLGAVSIGFVGLLIGPLLTLDRTAEGNLDPAGLPDVDAPAVAITERTGPVEITIEHRVASHDVAAFLRIMEERKRIRRRDGARRHALIRDLDEDDLWIERYHFPTWIDYVRYLRRRTKADETNTSALRALWVDGRDPVVRRGIERQARQPGRLAGSSATDVPIGSV